MKKTMKVRITDLLRSSVGLAAAGDSCCGVPALDSDGGSAEALRSAENSSDEECVTGGCCGTRSDVPCETKEGQQ